MKKITLERWKEANKGEVNHWNIVTSSEELTKQEDGYYRHAKVMALEEDNPSKITVIDIGGGPLSLTLHHDLLYCLVVDPIPVTGKFLKKYTERNTLFEEDTAEHYLENYNWLPFDEVWMYNCLQHVIDPEYILDNLYKVGKVLRISEPTNTPTNDMHPHTFTPNWLETKLKSISVSGTYNRIEYDFPYCGGKWVLK